MEKMNETYINILLALAVIVVPIGLGGLLIELEARQARNLRNRHRGDAPDCGIMNSNHPSDGK